MKIARERKTDRIGLAIVLKRQRGGEIFRLQLQQFDRLAGVPDCEQAQTARFTSCDDLIGNIAVGIYDGRLTRAQQPIEQPQFRCEI